MAVNSHRSRTFRPQVLHPLPKPVPYSSPSCRDHKLRDDLSTRTVSARSGVTQDAEQVLTRSDAELARRGITLFVSTRYECPGCGRAVEVGEDYVLALEYEERADFSLHAADDAPQAVERRFHVEHFRRQVGDRLFLLVQGDQTARAG